MSCSSPFRGDRASPDPTDGAAADPEDVAPLLLQATPMGVRAALSEMRARFNYPLPATGTLGMAETVLAEVLNNIVEHAYGSEGNGRIELRMARAGTWLRVDVRDYGAAMPDGKLPGGSLPGTDSSLDGPPEGGFGWFLIRAFARDLKYEHVDGTNRLTFTVPLCEEL
jgi:serine/threonine-protein kinase RsbW